MQIIVEGLVTNYEQRGSGPLVVCLHGWGDALSTFEGLVAALEAKYTVLSVDLPGFGKTQAPREVWNLDNYAHFVQAFLDKLQAGSPVAYVGHSNGGALLIRGLAIGTLRAKKLVLLASAGVRSKGSARLVFIKIIAKIGKVVTFWLPLKQRQKLQKMLYGAAGSDMLVVPELKETFKVTVRQDVQDDAAKLTLPTLLIYGSTDHATPLADGMALQSLIPGAKLETVEAGHFVHHDQPQKVAELIQGFLA